MIKTIISQISTIVPRKPEACIILGSGLGNMVGSLKNIKRISYKNIKGFLKTNVHGHKGEFVYGTLEGKPILCARGRFHYYEGYTFDQVGILIKIFNFFKPNKYIITNSCGCLRLDWRIGDFVLVNKFIDFSFINSIEPLKYHVRTNIKGDLLNRGTYAYTIGPTYETQAEIKEIIDLGGDIVGMSTFPEYLMCKKLNINPIIISCLTNYGAGLINKKIKHEDVLLNANKFEKKFNNLIKQII